MLNQLNRQELSALAALVHDPNFQTVLQWLKKSHQDLAIASCESRDEVLSRWQQGAVQAVGEFINRAESSVEVIRKSR